MDTSEHHQPPLDGLRGCAVLLVIAYHYIPLSFGWIGVDLFFLLSAYLLTGNLLRSFRCRNWLPVFYTRRVLRIIPLYFVLLTLLLLILPLLAPLRLTPAFNELLSLQPYYWTFSINWYNGIHGWTPHLLLVHCWSLACEMQFYLLLPLLVALVGGRSGRLIIASIICVACALLFRVWDMEAAGLHHLYRYVLLPARADAFGLGIMVAALTCPAVEASHVNGMRRVAAILFVATVLAIAGIVTAGYARWHFTDPFTSRYGLTLNAMLLGSLLTWVVTAPDHVLCRWLSLPWLRWCGRYSYGMYLWHVPILVLLHGAVRHPSLSFIPVHGAYVTAAAAALTLVCSMISHHAVEKPFLRMKPMLTR